MSDMYDFVVKNARLRNVEDTVNIAVQNGVIAEISRENLRGETEVDAEGNLITEPFVNPHLHLCKAYTFEMIGDSALSLYQGPNMLQAAEAIEVASAVKKSYKEDWIVNNAKKALVEAVKHGCLYVRAFVDTDTLARLTAVKAILTVKKMFSGLVDLQVVAFPQEGVVKDPGAEEMVWKAVEMGCDIVGGIPWIEMSENDSRRHIEKMFEIAKTHNRDVAMLTDDAGNANLHTTEQLASKTIEENLQNRVTAHHARALSLYPEDTLRSVIDLLKRAGLHIVSSPHTGPLHAPVKKLLENGVNVALGQDDLSDAYYPFGRNKMTEIAFMTCHLLRMMTKRDIETVFDMITVRPAKAMRIDGYGLKKGGVADFLILDAKSVYDAVWNQADPIFVFRRGKKVLERTESVNFHFMV